MKKFIIFVIVLIILGFGGYYLYQNFFTTEEPIDESLLTEELPEFVETPEIPQETATTTSQVETPENKSETSIGTSAGGLPITAHHFGTGATELLFVGGTHGGYSWNTALVAYQLIDHLKANPTVVPDNVRVTIIPVLNPDGLKKVTGKTGRFTKADVPATIAARVPGRFNGNTVDLNRNFDCDWQAKAVWQNKNVSGGSAAFSEPESKAIRAFVQKTEPAGIVVWYSAVGGVFTSNCHNGVSAETRAITNVYAKASGYRAYEEFNYYEITGDMVNWFAKEGYPAISVLLTTHESTEWTKNKAGAEAFLTHYAQ